MCGRSICISYSNSNSDSNFIFLQDWLGKEMNICIGDPKNPTTDGQHHTVKFKIPRETRKIYIRSGPEPNTFTVLCELGESESWDFAQIDSECENVKKIPFSEGTSKSFHDEDNKREQIWAKYVIPLIPLASAIVEKIACN